MDSGNRQQAMQIAIEDARIEGGFLFQEWVPGASGRL